LKWKNDQQYIDKRIMQRELALNLSLMRSREDPSSFNLISQENLIPPSNTRITINSKSNQSEISNSNNQFQQSHEEGKLTK
jgi:hypothetical protein